MVAYYFREALPGCVPAAFVAFISQGYLAVDLFFVLSGFVISFNYFDNFRELCFSNYLRFLGLRISRIYPLHLVVLLLFLSIPLATVIFSATRAPGQSYDFYYFALSLALMQNWGFVDELSWNVPAWSVSTEWFAYLLFPGIVCMFQGFARDRATTLLLGAVLLTALGGATHAAGRDLGANIATFGLLRCLLEFYIGISVYRLRAHQMFTPLVSAMSLICSATCFCAYMVIPLADYMVAPLGFALLIFGMTESSNAISRLLSVRTIEWLGLISYSTYLVHFFIRDWVKLFTPAGHLNDGGPFVAYVAVTFALSPVLYYLVERPGRRIARAATLKLVSASVA